MIQHTGVLNEILKEHNCISIAEDAASSSEFLFRKVIIFLSRFVDKAG